MAQTWPHKAPTEVVERRWTVPLADGDGISTVTAVGTGVTVNSDDYDLAEAVVVLSGGSAGATGSVAITVVTVDGNTHVETFYIAIIATTAQVVTARDVCNFALRKVAGVGNSATSTEQDDALELLRGLFARYRIGPVPLTAATEISVPDGCVLPLKLVLRKLAHATYNAPLDPTDAEMADWGDRYLTNTTFVTRDLSMPLAISTETVADLF